jgi:hypothetical protein
VNCTEATLTEIGSKWSKKQKRRSEVRENKMLDENIEEKISARRKDHEQLNKWKKAPMDAFEHLAGNMERQAGEVQKM